MFTAFPPDGMRNEGKLISAGQEFVCFIGLPVIPRAHYALWSFQARECKKQRMNQGMGHMEIILPPQLTEQSHAESSFYLVINIFLIKQIITQRKLAESNNLLKHARCFGFSHS